MQYAALGFCVCIYVAVCSYAQPEELTFLTILVLCTEWKSRAISTEQNRFSRTYIGSPIGSPEQNRFFTVKNVSHE